MWKAIYNDGTELPQYEEDGTENLFKSIEQSKLVKFVVRTETDEAIINLLSGSIEINGQKLDFQYNEQEHRLIYFRRTRTNLGPQGLNKVEECAGWQSTIPGETGPKNIKRIVRLDNRGKITIQCD